MVRLLEKLDTEYCFPALRVFVLILENKILEAHILRIASFTILKQEIRKLQIIKIYISVKFLYANNNSVKFLDDL